MSLYETRLLPNRAPRVAILAHEAHVSLARNAEAACALDFRVYGDGQPGEFFGQPVTPIMHAERCVCTPACSFNYDPWPNAEAEPVDTALYEGTGIGALYFVPGSPDISRALAGWNVRKEPKS